MVNDFAAFIEYLTQYQRVN